MRRAARTDDNHQDIVDHFRACGFSVFSTHGVGKGFPDIVIGRGGKNGLVEIKDGAKSLSRRALTTDEAAFHASWRGKIHIVNGMRDVLSIAAEWVA